MSETDSPLGSIVENCPECDAEYAPIVDHFSGSAKVVANFEEAKDRLVFTETPPEEEVEAWQEFFIESEEYPDVKSFDDLPAHMDPNAPWILTDERGLKEANHPEDALGALVDEHACRQCGWSERRA